MGKFVEEATKAGVIVATGGIAPTSEGAKITPEGRRVHRRRRPLRRGQGDRGRLGDHGVPRPGRGDRVVQALPRRAGRGRGPRPARHAERSDPVARAVVESVACRPPIRPPRSRRSSGWSSRGSSPRWRPFVGDIGLAEELAQDALVDALRQWPREGTPRNPGAWLTTVGKRKAVDLFRRNRIARGEVRPAEPRAAGGGAAERRRRVDVDPASSEDIPDDRLRLIFVACHPVLPVAARVALTLRLVGGLTVPEIARAYVVPEPTIAQRIVRAKKTIAKAGVPFEVPSRGGPGRPARHRARGDLPHLQRGLLGHRRRGLAPARALCRGAAARPCPGRPRAGRAGGPRAGGADGVPVVAPAGPHRAVGRARPPLGPGPPHLGPPPHQPGRGRAGARPTRSRDPRGPYALQAAIAACHARAFRPEETDWEELVRLYGELARTAPSPIVELNRAVAISMAGGTGRRAGAGRPAGRRRRRSTATTSSTACGATSSTGSADTPRPRWSSIAPPELATNAQERMLLHERAGAARAGASAGAAAGSAVHGGPEPA